MSRSRGRPDLVAVDWERYPAAGLIGVRSYSAELLTTVRPATEQEWRTRAISARVTLDEPVIDAAVRLTRARVNRGVRSVRRQSGRSCWAAGLFDRRAADISDRAGDLRDLYAQLFVGRLLGVEPLEQPEEIITISPLDIGNLIHYSMDEFIRDRAASLPTFGAPWTADLDSMLDGRQRLARRARRAGGGQRIDLRHEGFRACRRRGAAGSGAEVGSRIGPIWAD